MRSPRTLAALFAGIAALALSTASTSAEDVRSVPPPHPLDESAPPAPAPREIASRHGDANDDTFSPDEIVQAGSDFFGVTTEVMAKAVQRVTEDLGQPDGYIKGDEGSGAFVVGLRYGSGWLIRKGMEPTRVYWRGPSIGFDAGANGSKVFTLVYNLREERRLYQRFPGVEGSFYFVAGLGVNYMRSGGVTLAPIRTGVGLRAGVNAHYQVYSDRRDWFPL
ncbi:MAG: DUF1134 domain-containing protein [Alphaproteobacteria bacterium]|nr:DUF1134 domain-containing protein [Alphaproteobacteria bacterium]MBL6937323.1 DUF1134 domain-containing protein [Alphaproteobacteria bacterium]MBL7096115.1 DUF1134 domain-containing protein [Alphaproteobacteria bacterium]